MTTTRAHTDVEITAFLEELKKQTDRGVGIVAAAVLEDALEFALRSRLVVLSNTRAEALFGRMRPLSSFSAKIAFGFAVGLYDDHLRKPLNMIRDVRNEFAHNLEATSFEHPRVASLVRSTLAQDAPETVRQGVANQGASLRDTFMLFFSGALALLYAEAASDIRIRPVGETHPHIFVQLALAARRLAQKMASESTAPPERTGSPEIKPGQSSQ